MIHETIERVRVTDASRFDSLMSGLPPGSEMRAIDFVVESSTDQTALLELPRPIQRWAVLGRDDAGAQGEGTAPDLLILTVPTSNQDDVELLGKVQQWMNAGAQAYDPNSFLMTLQGAQILWRPGRLAVMAQSDRLPAVRMASIEALFYESELRDIERSLDSAWSEWEADIPLAFEFHERSVGKRDQLLQRFRQLLLFRARLARVAPYVHRPHLHPPTLASRVGERLRERIRMAYRHDVLIEQIVAFEKVYESCAQRASDFMLTRSNNILEWVIIALLLVQVLLALFYA